MTVLSDRTLRDRISKGDFILNGDANAAIHCSYEFTAAKVFRGGSDKGELVEDQVLINPAELVWIRAKEQVKMPCNNVGVWFQTQTLAKRGLLLLNTSLVEPGYEGPLTSVFVNFGQEPVAILPGMKIAKLLFHEVDQKAEKLVSACKLDEYDVGLEKVAGNAPQTFLQLKSFLPEIEEGAKRTLDAIEERAKNTLDTIDEDIQKKVDGVVEKTGDGFKKALQGDIRNTLLKWGGSIGAGLIIGCALAWAWITIYLPRLTAEYSSIEKLAVKALAEQKAVDKSNLTAQMQSHSTDIELLKTQIDQLIEQLNPGDANQQP